MVLSVEENIELFPILQSIFDISVEDIPGIGDISKWINPTITSISLEIDSKGKFTLFAQFSLGQKLYCVLELDEAVVTLQKIIEYDLC